MIDLMSMNLNNHNPIVQPNMSASHASFRFEIESDRVLSLEELEKAYLTKVTKDSNCSKERIAAMLGINRKTLYRKQKEYSL